MTAHCYSTRGWLAVDVFTCGDSDPRCGWGEGYGEGSPTYPPTHPTPTLGVVGARVTDRARAHLRIRLLVDGWSAGSMDH